MQNASITFCKANPTIDDGREFAHYLDEAAEGFFHFMLGRQFVEMVGRMHLGLVTYDTEYIHRSFLTLGILGQLGVMPPKI